MQILSFEPKPDKAAQEAAKTFEKQPKKDIFGDGLKVNFDVVAKENWVRLVLRAEQRWRPLGNT